MAIKIDINFSTAILYLLGSAAIPIVIAWIFIEDLILFAIALLLFVAPAFVFGFLLFLLMDKGLKMLWTEHSFFGIAPLAFALSVPFIVAYFAQAFIDYQPNIPISYSAAMLLWSVFVVGLQLRFSPQEKKVKSKNSL